MNSRLTLAVSLGAACVILIIALAGKGLNSGTKSIENKQGTVTHSARADYATLLESAHDKEGSTLPAEIADTDELLKKAKDLNEKKQLLEKAVAYWEKAHNLAPAAYYQQQLATYISTDSNWYLAGDYAYHAGSELEDTVARRFLMQEAITYFDKALEITPGNTDAKVQKAVAIMDNRENIMAGVSILLAVDQEFPDNIPANYTLGILAIESGQLDKALIRFEKLISLQPSNPEYTFQTGRVYEMKGQNAKAATYYRKSLANTTDESSKKKLQDIINNLN